MRKAPSSTNVKNPTNDSSDSSSDAGRKKKKGNSLIS